MDAVDAIRALGGTARRKDLSGQVSWRTLRRAEDSGVVVRAAGVWSLVDSGRDRVLAAQLRAVRTHRTAAEHWGLALPPCSDSRHSLAIPRNVQRKGVPAEVRLRYRTYAEADVLGDVTTVAMTVLDCLRDESLQVALCVGDSALNQQLVTLPALRERARHLRGPGSATVRERVELLDAGAANAFESSCRALMVGAGITGFRTQLSVRHPESWIGLLDLGDPERKIAIECDGFETHGGRTAFVRDRVRLTYLVSCGWRTLVFTWEQVMFRPEWVLARIMDTIALVERDARQVQRASRGRKRAA